MISQGEVVLFSSIQMLLGLGHLNKERRPSAQTQLQFMVGFLLPVRCALSLSTAAMDNEQLKTKRKGLIGEIVMLCRRRVAPR